jgi:dihydroneopterin aldolase
VIVVELEALEIFGRHGASEEERAAGQTFLFDLRLEISDAALSDRLEDTVDYVQVAEAVRAVSDARQFHLLEALAAAAADAVMERFSIERVQVRVRKRDVAPAGLPVAWTAATVVRP